MKITYRKAGVDINKANRFVEDIKPMVASTRRDGWVGNIGAFAGFFRPAAGKYKRPLLVASTDGVGTKLLIAQQAGKNDTVGIDLVAMCVNDLVTCGAEPLFFLDYFGTGKIKPCVARDILKGIAEGCRIANVALIGGETAELPDMYGRGVYDIAGFAVGMVDEDGVIDGSSAREGDLILGIQSSGIHSNGYSMVRKVFSKSEIRGKLKDELLRPTLIYVRPILELIRALDIKGIAHITGGGFFDNVIRILPENKAAVMFKRAWQVPEIFNLIQKRGNVDEREMFRTFNMGIGMVIVTSKQAAWKAKRILLDKYGLESCLIGEIIKGRRRVELIDS
ncbi:MAG: phosphoribosylformylglycinamidine cyclo-ligase [Candidatus Omnitrophota bacterium]